MSVISAAHGSQSKARQQPLRNPLAESLTRRLAGIIGASLFVGAAAHLSFPLPYTPVPLTLSDLSVLLVGLVLGPRLGFAALALYLVEGSAGLPVFSPSGPGGLAQFHITGGYLLAYPFAAALTGFLARAFRAMPAYLAGLLAASCGTLLIMASGAAWLSVYTHHVFALTLRWAVLPFLPGQAVKIACAAGIYRALGSRFR